MLGSGAGFLPAQITRFFGREGELADLLIASQHERLVSLVGAPGCGKTRLAVEVAARRAPGLAGGVRFVDLARLSDPMLLPTAVAAALGVCAEPGRAVVDTLVDALREAEPVLVVIDNCEHLVEEVAELTQRMLAGCSSLTMLVTSRVVLGLQGERVWRVPPLDAWAAVALFEDRAALAADGFALGADDRPVVEDICARLEGLPLAIELAAAWVRMLSPQQIADRLLPLLTVGPLGRGRRHETMAATVDWSCRLLPLPARQLFERLSVFAGEFDLEAVAVVADVPDDEVLGLLTTLVDHSLVAIRGSGGEARRYRLLEPVRQCGAARLAASAGADEVRRRHARHYMAVVGAIDSWGEQGHGKRHLPVLQAEEANLLAALDWARREGSELTLDLADTFGVFCEYGEHVNEGRAWFDALIAADGIDPLLEARAYFWSGRLAWRQGRYDEARDLLAAPAVEGAFDHGTWAHAYLLVARAAVAASAGDAAAVGDLCAQAADIATACGSDGVLAGALITWSWADYLGGDPAVGDKRAAEGLTVNDRVGSATITAQGHFALQHGAFLRGDAVGQRTHLLAALDAMDGGGLLDTSDWLGCCAALAVSEGRYLAALRLLGGVGAKRKRSGSGQADSIAGPVVTHLEQLRGRVEPMLADQLAAEGATMSWSELVAEATATTEDAPTPRAPLSPREVEIAELVAEGLTNAEIARKLTISRRTVDSHLDHIRRKLGLRNRRQIVIWSFQQSRRRAGAA